MLSAKKEGYFRSDDSGIMGGNLRRVIGCLLFRRRPRSRCMWIYRTIERFT